MKDAKLLLGLFSLALLMAACGPNYYKLALEQEELGESKLAYIYYAKAVYDGKMEGSDLMSMLKSKRSGMGEEAFWEFIYDVKNGVDDEMDRLEDAGQQERADSFEVVENFYTALYDKQLLEISNTDSLFQYGS